MRAGSHSGSSVCACVCVCWKAKQLSLLPHVTVAPLPVHVYMLMSRWFLLCVNNMRPKLLASYLLRCDGLEVHLNMFIHLHIQIRRGCWSWLSNELWQAEFPNEWGTGCLKATGPGLVWWRRKIIVSLVFWKWTVTAFVSFSLSWSLKRTHASSD